MKKRLNRSIIYILILVALSLFQILGQWDGEETLFQVTPMLNSLEDSTYLENDFYVQETSGFNVRYFFLKLVLLVDDVVNSHDLAYILVLFAAYAGITLATYNLIRMIYKDRDLAFLTAALINFVSYAHIGGLSLFARRPNAFAFFFIFLALNYFWLKKYKTGYLVLGLSVLFQPISGLLFFSTAILCHTWSSIIKLNLIEAIKKGTQTLTFFITASINLVPLYILGKRTALPEYSKEVTQYTAIFKHYKHADPTSWPITDYALFGIFLTGIAAIYKRINIPERIRKVTIPYLLSLAIFSIIGYIFVVVYPNAFVAKAQMYRPFVLLSIFGYFILFKYLYDQTRKQTNTLAILYYVGLATMFFYSKTIPIAITLIILDLVFNIPAKFEFIKIHKSIVSISLITSTALVAYFAQQIYSILPQEYLVVALKVLIFFTLSFMIYKNANLILPTLIIALSFTAITVLDWTGEQACSPVQGVSDFAQTTPEDSIFIIPPQEVMFRVCSERAIVIDLNALFLDTSLVKQYERMTDILNVESLDGIRGRESNSYYFQLDEPSVIHISDKYNATHFITSLESKDNFKFNEIYSDEEYIIFELPSNS